MVKNFAVLLVLLMATSYARAQEAGNIHIKSVTNLRSTLDCGYDAGQVTLTNSQGITLQDRIIPLPFGDSIQVSAQNYAFGGDPDPATAPGITYFFYACAPSIDSSTITEIAADPCRLTTPFFYLMNGDSIARTDSFWVSTSGDRLGNLNIVNTGAIQTGFGAGAPYQLWFAPATIDDFNNRTYENGGSCVSVSSAAAFSVIYLNPIRLLSSNNNTDGGGCTGSFVLDGGLPEFDTTATYQVSIRLQSDSNVQGTIFSQGLVRAGDSIPYFVPQSGTYDIQVQDEAGSTFSFPMDMQACELVNFQFPLENHLPGDAFCLPLTVNNFNEVGVLEFDLNWDPAILEMTNIIDLNSNLDFSIPLHFNTSETASGTLRFSWFFSDGGNISLPENDTLFTLCFTAVGQLGDRSPIQFIPSDQTNNTVGRDLGSSGLAQLGYVFNDGQVNLSNGSLFLDIEQQNISCNPINDGPTNDGAISLRIAQGVAPYLVTYQNLTTGSAATTASLQEREVLSLTSLVPGDYRFNITDQAATPLDTTLTLTIVEPEGFRVSTDVQSDISCFMGNDGIMTTRILDARNLPIPNPESLFTFAWSTGDSTISISGLEAGLYEVTVTDQNGCMAVGVNTLSARPPIQLSLDVIQPATCLGISDGGATISASGGETNGSSAYTFAWEGGQIDSISTQSILTGVQPGMYTVSMTDDLGCVQTDSIEITAQKTLRLTQSTQDVSCFAGSNGVISLISSADNSEALPYSFIINGPASGTPTSITPNGVTYTNLTAGSYNVEATDADGCLVTARYSIREPELLQVMVDSIRGESCPVGLDGFASVAVSGGTAPYRYQWDDPTAATDSFVGNLVADTLQVIVFDTNSCTDSAEIVILPQNGPQIVAFANDSVSCSGDANGVLSVEALAGNAPIINYSWNTGVSGPDATEITNLSPGSYELTITANDGCQTFGAAVVVDPAPLVIDSIDTSTPLCPGFANGTIAVFASGGTLPFTYTWDDTTPPASTPDNLRAGLSAGIYGVTVVDANNCPAVSATAEVSDPPSIQISFQDITGVTCAEGADDGIARAIASLSDGSTQLFDFNWSNGVVANNTTQTIASTLAPGINTLIVFDENGCSATDSVNIPSPEAISLALNATAPSCNGLSDGSVRVQVGGGTPDYDYLWLPGNTTDTALLNLGAGTYILELTDANGCVKTDSVRLIEPDALVLSIDTFLTENPRCADTQDGILAVSVNSNDNINPLGAAPYTWSDGFAAATASVATDLPAGTYSVTVTDTRGCTDAISYTLTQPTPIVFSFQQPADPPCFGDATFFSIDNISGGVGTGLLDYTYQIDNNGISFIPDQQATIFAGTHIITVEDFNGCAASDTVTINQPDELSVRFNPAVVEVELGDTLTRLNPIVNTEQVDSLIWTPTEGLLASNTLTPIVVPANDQLYSLRIVDSNGCTAEGSVLVELNRARNVYLPNIFSPNGDGRNDEFRLYACRGVSSVNYARVFDRWGNLVYNQDDLGMPDCAGGTVLWDGEINNRLLPAGVYVYVIEITFVDNVTLTYRGDIALMR